MVRHELPLEHRGHNLRPWRVHLSHLLKKGASNFPFQTIGRVRGIGDVIVHGLGEESQERCHGFIMPIGRHPEPRVRPPYDDRLAHRLSLVGLRHGEGSGGIAQLQHRIRHPARSGPVGTFLVCPGVNHPVVLKQGKEYPVDVWDVLLPVWRAYYLSGDYSYHILLPPWFRVPIFMVPSERDLAILDSCLRLAFSAFSAS